MKIIGKWLCCGLLAMLSALGGGQLSAASRVTSAIESFRERLAETMPEEQLVKLTEAEVIGLLTPEERKFFSSEYIRFRVNQPVEVHVLRSVKEQGGIFWLDELGFELQADTARANLRRHQIWSRKYEPGLIGLGVNTFAPQRDPVFIVVEPQADDSENLKIIPLSPEGLTLDRAVPGKKIYSDDLAELQEIPESLQGGVLLQTPRWERDHVKVVQYFKNTAFPSTDRPDQVVLTWSKDPSTTQTLQWRTGPGTSTGAVKFLKAEKYFTFSPSEPETVQASSVRYRTPGILNDPVNYRHEVTLEGLEPDTEYVYAVGDGSNSGWGTLHQFQTAPESPETFSFIFMGDVQRGIEDWGLLLERTYSAHPEAAFYLLGGDLVNWGVDRDNWDTFFAHASPVFSEKSLVPVVGNHEAYGPGRHPTLYLDFLGLPLKGPFGIEPERAYSFSYGNALFVILDSMQPAEAQAEWLDRILADSSATWKIVSFHFALYPSEPDRDYRAIREAWVPVLDRHEVDLVLQGHDHVYGRTFPMRAHRPVIPGEKGTIYVTAYAGTKHGEGITPNAEVSFTGVPTYQL